MLNPNNMVSILNQRQKLKLNNMQVYFKFNEGLNFLDLTMN